MCWGQADKARPNAAGDPTNFSPSCSACAAVAAALQRQGLIKYHRGDIETLNRRGLKKAACGCYARDRKVYGALLHQRL